MNRIRVLRVQSRICVGGPALNTILLSAFIDPARYQTLLVGGCLEPGEKSMESLAREKGVAIHIIGEMNRRVGPFNDLKALWKLMRLCRYYRPHIIHTHTAKAGALGRLAAFLCRVPVRVHTFHGHVFHGYFSPFKSGVFIRIERLLARGAHRIIAISPKQKRDLCEVYKIVPPEKCCVIRLGFELEKLASAESGRFRQRLGLAPDTRLVGLLARLVPIKNHRLLLEAIAHLQTLWPAMTPADIRFLIIGDGELRAELQELALHLGIAQLVQFTGWQSEVGEIYADLDLNVLVSRNEGTPVTLIEGLARGVPFLTTDVGGIRDFVDLEHGRIVAPDIPPAELASHLLQLLQGERRLKRLNGEARRRILETFDVKRLVGEMEQLYQELYPTRA